MAVVGSTVAFLVIFAVWFFLIPLLSTTSPRLLSWGTLKMSVGDVLDLLGDWLRLFRASLRLNECDKIIYFCSFKFDQTLTYLIGNGDIGFSPPCCTLIDRPSYILRRSAMLQRLSDIRRSSVSALSSPLSEFSDSERLLSKIYRQTRDREKTIVSYIYNTTNKKHF